MQTPDLDQLIELAKECSHEHLRTLTPRNGVVSGYCVKCGEGPLPYLLAPHVDDLLNLSGLDVLHAGWKLPLAEEQWYILETPPPPEGTGPNSILYVACVVRVGDVGLERRSPLPLPVVDRAAFQRDMERALNHASDSFDVVFSRMSLRELGAVYGVVVDDQR